ncbi:MAG: YgeY family selenium metabolism-linked hydrolase [Armatimonadetes bacterium]|nr:YgeY family selenium metabolism-linked hydrolase [Armatimonadota bacterium]
MNLNLNKKIKDKQKNLINFLRDIIAIPSPSTQEKAVGIRILKEMRDLKFDEVFVDKMGNCIGKIGKGKFHILYDAHIDTVGIGDIRAWQFNPYSGKIKNGIIYGRGASDNKAAIACQIYAARLIKELNLLDNFTLYVVGTVQEEDCDGLSMEYLIKNSIKRCDFVILGECTNLSIYRGQRGRMEIKIKVAGKAAHASAPERGKNAIYKMAPIISKIKKLDFKKDSFLGKGSIAVTKIESKSASLNSIPDECTIYLDRRLTKEDGRESALRELKEISSDIQVEMLNYQQPSYTGLTLSAEKYFPAWALEEEHILVKAAKINYKKIFSQKPKVGKWTFSTNGVASMGKLNIPTIGFGPGEEKFSHTTNDRVSIEHLLKTVMFYTTFPKTLVNLLEG